MIRRASRSLTKTTDANPPAKGKLRNLEEALRQQTLDGTSGVGPRVGRRMAGRRKKTPTSSKLHRASGLVHNGSSKTILQLKDELRQKITASSLNGH